MLAGGARRTLPAPLDELPLLVRAGAVLPLLPADVDTLAPYGGDGGVVNLEDRRDRLDLLAFPRGSTKSRYERKGTIRSIERDGEWVLDFDGPGNRRFRLQAGMSALRAPFAPRRVELDGRRLDPGKWSYDRRTGVLEAAFSGRSGRLAVSG